MLGNNNYFFFNKSLDSYLWPLCFPKLLYTLKYALLTALRNRAWLVCWNLRLGSVCDWWYCTLEIALISVIASFQRFVQVPETSEFIARLMTGCRYCACRVWQGGLFLCFIVSYVVLSIGVIVCEKTSTPSHNVSVQLQSGKYNMCSNCLYGIYLSAKIAQHCFVHKKNELHPENV